MEHHDASRPEKATDEGKMGASWWDREDAQRHRSTSISVGGQGCGFRTGPAQWHSGRSELLRKVKLLPNHHVYSTRM
jgi:hypothetical protein